MIYEEELEDTEVDVQAEEKRKIPQVKPAVIYVGPFKKGTILKPYTVFSDGIPEEYADHKIYKHLFVVLNRFSFNKTMAKINHKGSNLNTFYEQAKKLN